MIISTGVNVLLNLTLIGYFGYIVCAYTTAFSYLVYAVLHTIFVRSAFRGLIMELYNKTVLLTICILIVPLTAIIFFLYPYPVIRYALILAVIVAALLKKEVIIDLIRSVRTNVRS